MQEVRIIVRNGFIKDVFQPDRSALRIYDYDLKKFSSVHPEKDENGRLCKITNWLKFPYDNNYQQIREIDHEIVVELRNGKVRTRKCPKDIQIVVTEEHTEKPRRR